MHSAKALPSAALGNAHTAKKALAKTALPIAFYRVLGKAFAECKSKMKKSQKNSKFFFPEGPFNSL
jgi:hypothetical protein